MTTRLTAALGIRHPIVLAGMAGGPTTPELVAAVSQAGGLGTFGLTGMSLDAARDAVARACALTSAPIAVNVLVAPATPADPSGPDPHAVLAPMRAELGLPRRSPGRRRPPRPRPGSWSPRGWRRVRGW